MMNEQNKFFPVGTLVLALVVFGAPFGSGESAEREVTSETDETRLTPVPVEIDPLGADRDTPWAIHVESLRVRDVPSLEHSAALGTAADGTAAGGRYVIVEETDEEWLEVNFLGQPGYLFRLGFMRVHPSNAESIAAHGNLPYGEEVVNRWWGIPLDYEPDDLVTLPAEYTRDVDGAEYRLRREAAEALTAMVEAMREDGLEVYVSSAYRSGSRQKGIYTRSTGRRSNQRSSAPPGHSEHQLGVTVDLSSSRERRRSLRNTDPQHAWLTRNAARYGWRQTYLAENIDETGYIEEPWHWRYVGEKLIKK